MEVDLPLTGHVIELVTAGPSATSANIRNTSHLVVVAGRVVGHVINARVARVAICYMHVRKGRYW